MTGQRWADAEVRSGGRTVARMPYVVSRHFDGPAIVMPPMTHFLGPAFLPGDGGETARWLRRLELVQQLISALPRYARFHQKLHAGLRDTVAFQAAGFDTAVQFTHEVAPAPEAALWAALRDKHRNVIRRAQERLVVEPLADPEEFTRYYQDNLRLRHRLSWHSAPLMRQLIEAALARDTGRMLGARDGNGQLLAATFCARDAKHEYFTFSTRRPDAGNGAIPLLIWENIRRAASAGRCFDFDGLPDARSISLFAGFGGAVAPRYVVSWSFLTPPRRAILSKLHRNTSPYGA